MSSSSSSSSKPASSDAKEKSSEPKRARLLDDDDKQQDKDQFVFFWREFAQNGWMSNWSKHSVTENEITYPTVEHFFVAEKARTFGDEESLLRILNSKTPAEAKRIGSQVRGYEEATWFKTRQDVMLRGLKLKVSQHPSIAEQLRATSPRIIAEASPYDKIWGIGCSQSDARARNPYEWPGHNLLGEAWMRVRDALLREDAAASSADASAASSS